MPDGLSGSPEEDQRNRAEEWQETRKDDVNVEKVSQEKTTTHES